ncbi:MAG: hypothetical protein QM496_18720 [Verrucomicrobiota bacterium]
MIKAEDRYSDIFRIDTENGWGKILTRINEGFYNEMSIGRDRAKISTIAPIDRFVVLTFIWNGPKETHQLFVVDKKNQRYDSPEGVAPKEAMDIKSITIGDAHDNKHSFATGKILELVVYDRALHASERTELEDYYKKKYFK